ncbi:hypothetical protein ACFY7H_10955 [Streptomyces sp. NPDC012794]|uniref:hypothetical protein n=1 Tax=Streptomyces sp. NPDC012794 TaxID=3364850 RepID=UPI003692C9F4
MDADAEMDLDEIVDALYRPHPAGFTAARDAAAARVKEAGDPAAAKRIAALRRPTLAAWASNTLVRAKPDETEQFLQLGQTLRAAHRSLDGERLRDLSHQQHVVIGALAREAARLAEEAGTPVSETVVRELEQILRAVLADPVAAATWASGRLVRAPAPVSDFPAVDPGVALPSAVPEAGVREPGAPEPGPSEPAAPDTAAATEAGAVAGTEAGTAAEPVDRARAARIDAARAAAEDAAWAASAREEELRMAEQARQHAVARAAEADAVVARLQEETEQARAARDLAYEAVAEAEAGHRQAERAAREARHAAASAQRRLRRL